jgi:hypothetical protein
MKPTTRLLALCLLTGGLGLELPWSASALAQTCQTALGGACSETEPCCSSNSSLVCISNTCRAWNTFSCPDNSSDCASGDCLGIYFAGHWNYTCQPSAVLGPCWSNSNCQSGLVCDLWFTTAEGPTGTCVEPTDQTCAEDADCGSNKCVSSCECSNEGEACATDSDCCNVRDGEVCSDGTCARPVGVACTNNDQCATGECYRIDAGLPVLCQCGNVGNTCGLNEECCGDLMCAGGFCQVPTTDSCVGGGGCASGNCSDGTCTCNSAYGDLCYSSNDCCDPWTCYGGDLPDLPGRCVE